ncbi:hypothetical protein ES705_31146 [subsurface metagenome]
MARLTPAEFQEKHARRLSAAVEDVRKGIDRVTVNPCELAAAKQEKMLANLTAAVNDGRWAAGLKRVSLAEWKDKAKNVGAGRIATGINAAKAKVIAFAEELLPHIDAGQAKLTAMPDITLEDNIARMTSFIRHMAEFKRTK